MNNNAIWKRFMENADIDANQIKEDILSSWKRCKSAGVSPYDIDQAFIMNPKDKNQYNIEHLTLNNQQNYKEFNEICKRLNMCVSIYDEVCNLKLIFNYPDAIDGMYPEAGFLLDASEKSVGTNSTSVALYENRPSMVIGVEHYNYTFHNYSCAAAPIYDQNQNIVGTVNASFLHTSINQDTLNVIYSIARIYENIILNNIKEKNNIEGLTAANEEKMTFDEIVGESVSITKAKEMAKRASKVDSHVLLYGENGSGKEIFAKAIHNNSSRGSQPFVAINCAAIPKDLIESELFGYEKGAFTGALKDGKVGLFEYASKGTLFFDEVESMPLDVQIKVLRAVSEKEIKRIGGLKPIPIDVRIVSATKKELVEEVTKGNFREDLYYRINVIQINIPTLKERIIDIPLIFQYYLTKLSSEMKINISNVDSHFIDYLQAYDWPGNVRQLINMTERAMVFSNQGNINIDLLPSMVHEAYLIKKIKNDLKIVFDQPIAKEKNILEIAEGVIIEKILEEENYNVSRAAERLGMSRPTLYKKIENANIDCKKN